MYKISAAQSKAARAFLEWSQDDLCKAAHLAASTVRSFENGITPRDTTMYQICRALERAGIEFTDGGGIRPRSDMIRIYMGNDSCEQFFEDILQTVEKDDGEIVFVAQTQEIILASCGLVIRNRSERLELLSEKTDVKCIVAESSSLIAVPPVQFRTLPKYQIGPWSYCIFGNKYAHIINDGRTGYHIVVFHQPLIARDHLNHFHLLWEHALPLKRTTIQLQKRIIGEVEAVSSF